MANADSFVVVTLHREEETDRQIQKIQEETLRRRKSQPKNQHIRRFGNITVTTLSAVDAQQPTQMNADAEAFLQRMMAPTRKRMNLLEGHPALFSKKQKLKMQRA